MTYNPKERKFVQAFLPLFGSENETSHNFVTVTDNNGNELLVNLLALASVKGIGFKTLCHLFDMGLAQNVWHCSLQDFSDKFSQLPGKHPEISKYIYEKKDEFLEKGRTWAEKLRSKEIHFIPLGNQSYPKALEKLSEPPRWLFLKGNLDVLHHEAIIAIVGTRKASAEGERLAYWCAKELASFNIVVLSGLAKGIDEKAHLGAVEYYGQSIAVLGHGIDAPSAPLDAHLVSKILDTDGVLISEYLPYDPPSRLGYLRRNELQAALARVVIPVEAPSLESGTGATIRRAMKLKTPVVGIIPANSKEPALLTTRDNLSKLGHKVFEVYNGNISQFWAYLREVLPNHSWSSNPHQRQDRFFRTIERQVLEASQKVPIDEEAIDRLATRLKNRIGR